MKDSSLAGLADDALQFLGQSPARHDADQGVGVGKAGVFRGDQDVAGQGNLEAPVMATPLMAPTTGLPQLRMAVTGLDRGSGR